MLENYERLPNGVIKQVVVHRIEYNYDYSNKYNNYGEKGKYLSYMRLGVLTGLLGRYPTSIVDVGYGNGDFLAVCKKSIDTVYGCDLSDYPVPDGCKKIEFKDIPHVDVTCFFDSLEHFDDINVVKNLDSDYVFISVPWCHYLSDEWFDKWYHRRENEHLYHFNEDSLIQFFSECGYDRIYTGCFEDIVRKNQKVEPLKNILSGLFKKRIT
jgi:SAM-dependent methyltransferase